MPSRTYIDREFKGINTYIAPSELGPGLLTQCDNLRVDGGDLVTRPGLQGVLTTNHSGPVYGLFAHVLTGGVKELLYASGGQLYRYVLNPPTPIDPNPAEIKLNGSSFNLNSPGVMLERAGRYVYGVDGVNSLFRVDDAGNGTSVSGLTAPPNALAAALTSYTVDDFGTPDGWQSLWSASRLPVGAGSNQLPNGGQFSPAAVSALSGSTAGGGWTPINADGSIDLSFLSADAAHPSDKYIQLDDGGDEFQLTTPIVNAQLQETYGGTTTGTGRFATSFAFSAQYNASYITGKAETTDSIEVTVTVYLDAPTYPATPTFLAEQTQTFVATGTSRILHWDGVFSFPALDTPIRSYSLNIKGTSANHPGNNGPYVGLLSLAPLDPGITFTASGGHVGVVAPIKAGVAALGGVRIIKDLGTDQDFSGLSHLSIGYSAIADYTGFGATLGLRKSDGTTTLTNPVTVAADGKSLNVDISTLPAADRTAIRYLQIILTNDLSVSSSGNLLFMLGPLTSAGNLSVGYADYQWLYTEVQDVPPTGTTVSGDTLFASILESNPSSYSNALTPTDIQATALLTLPTRPSGINTGATHFRIYRLGGTVGFSNGASDGLARLLGTWAFGTSGPSKDNADRLAAYDSTRGNVTDNVPDADLLSETTVTDFGRDSLPSGAQAICFYQGRLGAAVGSQFYWSWLVDSDGAAGLYFNTVLDPNDPNAAIKGGLYPIGGDDNDPITRFDPFASQLVIWKSRSAWSGTGSDALDLRVQQFLSDQGVGCVAPRGGGKVGNQIWVRGADSLYQFDVDTVDDVGTAIERTLNADAKDDAFVYHGRRAFWVTKSAGASANDSAWVFDTRTGQFVRYTGFAVTGGVSLASGENTDNVYFAGYDGQIYQLTGTGDKPNPSADAAPMHWTAKTRAFGTDTGRDVTATHALCELSVQEATTLTLTVQEDGGSRAASASYSMSGPGEYRLRLRLAPGKARGRALTVAVSGASSMPLRLQAVGLEAVTGARESG